MRLIARDMRVSLYLVGGSVRDLLLGRAIRDLDLVTENDGPKLAGAIAEQLGGRLVVHRKFSTATLESDDLRLDFSTARRETYPQPGALPQVAPSGMDDDLRRRDFSVNAMALGLAGHSEGALLDPCGGSADLKNEVIRVLHGTSFIDDPTRMFRAVRYAQRLGFAIEADTLRLLQDALAQNALSTLSGDRIRRELDLMLAEALPVPVLLQTEAVGLLGATYPGLSTDSLRQLDGGGVYPPLVYLAALTYPLSPQQTAGLISRLNMPSEWASVVRDASDLHVGAEVLATQDLRPSQAVDMLDGRHTWALEAARQVCSCPRVSHCIERYLSEWRHVGPCLKGGDLAALGVTPGPETGRILKELGRARLDEQVSTLEEEIALVVHLLESGLMEGVGGTA